MLDDWHSRPEVYDDELDAQIHRWYADVLATRSRKVWPPRNVPYFSPSSATACPRSQYVRLLGAKRESNGQPPHQGRWQRIGTSIGDIIQRDLLFIEKHTERSRFKFERNAQAEPMFEEFAKVSVPIVHNGMSFALYGTCDGIMTYISDDGEVLRVGLEVKSKQGTYSKTSAYEQRNGPQEDHVAQTVCYSIMYGTANAPLDYYVIVYVNGSKKSWNMTEEEYEKNPDIAVYCIKITEEMRAAALDRFADIVDAADRKEPPELDIEGWTFNNFKRACAVSLSDEELAQIERKVSAVQRSNLKDWQKRQYAEVLAEIKAIREAV